MRLMALNGLQTPLAEDYYGEDYQGIRGINAMKSDLKYSTLSFLVI